MDYNKYEENEGVSLRPPPPHFLYIGYGPSVACTVGCTWLMYSLCMAHIWPMYDLYMVYTWPIYGPTLICCKFGTFTSASVFEHAQILSLVFNDKDEYTLSEGQFQ